MSLVACIVDRHHVDVIRNPDPDQNFHVDADFDPDCHQNDVDPTLGFNGVKSKFFFYFVTTLIVYNVVSFSSVTKVKIF